MNIMKLKYKSTKNKVYYITSDEVPMTVGNLVNHSVSGKVNISISNNVLSLSRGNGLILELNHVNRRLNGF